MLVIPEILHPVAIQENSEVSDIRSDDTDNEFKEFKSLSEINIKNSESTSIINMYELFVKTGLLSVFPNWFTILKIDVNLPIESTNPKRSFLEQKIVKIRLTSCHKID